MRKTKSLLIGLVALAAAVGGVHADDTLVVYSGRSDKFVKPVAQAFTRATGINVVLHNASSTSLLNKLRVEGARTQADLYLSNDAGNLQMGSSLGLFQALSPDLVGAIDAQWRAPDDTWVGLSARARVLVVNTNVANPHIASVFDLAGSAMKGRIGITHSSNESFIAGVTVYLLEEGEATTRAWLEGMKANVEGEVFNKHSHIVKAVAGGRLDVGLVNHYYIFRHLDQHPGAPIRVLLPDQGEHGMGVAVNVAGVAISKYSRKKALAEKFVGFLVSEEGQKLFAGLNREYPTRKGVPAAAEVPPMDSFKVAPVPMYKLAELRNKTIDLIEAVGMP
ncbi:MAG TPA: extracellular solute-binding protein [Gammaproteobacteria bacterium]|nr:extracellular solute-binding protein [Gammaproteobacteria bacterium]